MIEGGIDFETLVWPTPVQPRVDPVTHVVTDLEVSGRDPSLVATRLLCTVPFRVQVVSFIKGRLFYTPWLELTANPKLLAMPLVQVLLGCMRSLGPEADIRLMRCVDGVAVVACPVNTSHLARSFYSVKDTRRLFELSDAYQKGCDNEGKRTSFESTLPTIAILVKDRAIAGNPPATTAHMSMEVRLSPLSRYGYGTALCKHMLALLSAALCAPDLGGAAARYRRHWVFPRSRLQAYGATSVGPRGRASEEAERSRG